MKTNLLKKGINKQINTFNFKKYPTLLLYLASVVGKFYNKTKTKKVFVTLLLSGFPTLSVEFSPLVPT